LVTALGQIQYGQSAVSQRHSRSCPCAVAVRAAMAQTLRHAAGDLDTCLRTHNAGYSTHGGQFSSLSHGRGRIAVPLAIGRRFV